MKRQAIDILENLYKDNPHSEQVKESLIKTLLAFGGYLNDEYSLQYHKAKEKFERILQIDPTNYRAHYNLGIANFNLENIEQAKQCYEEAIRIKPDYKFCFYNLGLIYEREGNLQEALKHYEIALEIDSNFLYVGKKQKKLEQLKSLLEMSKRIKIEMIQTLLNIDNDKFLNLIIEWGKKYQFKIDGDFLIINKEEIPKIIKSLEEMDI
ncbi:MAG: tetratricopeptide repeat protein [Promethearchaeota archaeon]